jgi:hypothetical protein
MLRPMIGISYSAGTPAVSCTLDRLGRQKTITDATGTQTFTYNDALQLASETVPVAAGTPHPPVGRDAAGAERATAGGRGRARRTARGAAR